MASLPDELWTKILGMGVEKQVLDYRDLCSLAFVCRRIRRISSLECMWRPLWERDQAELGGGTSTRNSVSEARKDNEIKSFRDLYRIRFEKVRAAKMAAHKRRVLRMESQVAVLQKEAQQYQLAIEVERNKLSASVAELKRFELACRSSIALQIWQPQAVRSRHHEVLQQESVNVGVRQRSLQMEINVCRERVQQFEKSLQAKRSAIEKSKRELEGLTFNPSRKLHDCSTIDERADRGAALKRKRDTSSSSSQTPQSV